MKTRNYVFYVVKLGSFLDGEKMVHCWGKHSHEINQGCLEIYDDGVLKSTFRKWSSFDIKHKTVFDPETHEEARQIFENDMRLIA